MYTLSIGEVWNAKFATYANLLQFWLCGKWTALLSLVYETALHGNEFASFRRQPWSNIQ